jgi:transcriptional adapter 3
MTSKLTPYNPPKPIQSSLLKKPPASVPPIEELQSLKNELKELKHLTLARSRKAGEDMKILEESLRRMRDKDKGKAKAIEKIKRERGGTYFERRRVYFVLISGSVMTSYSVGIIPD